MAQDSDAIMDATTFLLGATLTLLDRLGDIARHMHPPRLAALVETLADHDAVQRSALEQFRAAPWPDRLAGFREQAEMAADFAGRSAEGLRVALASDNPMLGAYRAFRHASRATEALYPLCHALPTVSKWFLEPDCQDDASLLAALRQPREGTGVMHVENDTRQRGGFSVYVPENHDPALPAPLIVALHGGAGHGRLFLWTWVREARSRGLILVAPTASGDTWSMMDPETDTAHLSRVLAWVNERWKTNPERRLLTGMSDGGTFTLVSGLDADSPFTHLAPVAASFHPLLLAVSEPQRLRGLPIMLTHGALDWMFPVSVGRSANRALTAAEAKVVYREIPDLSHAYPREENAGILDWFLS
jgi:phospholipase/carboxylesterase